MLAREGDFHLIAVVEQNAGSTEQQAEHRAPETYPGVCPPQPDEKAPALH